MMTLSSLILQRIDNGRDQIWTPVDFFDLGNSEAIKKALQRLVNKKTIRRVDRGLYDKPRMNLLTGQLNAPDYRKVIDAVSRRDQVRILIDGMTCANDLGLTNAVPGQVLIHTDGRLRPIRLGNLLIKFKLTAPSKLYWASRPGMRIVQSLYWLEPIIQGDEDNSSIIREKLTRLIVASGSKHEILSDLKTGLSTLPVWMQNWLQDFFRTFTVEH